PPVQMPDAPAGPHRLQQYAPSKRCGHEPEHRSFPGFGHRSRHGLRLHAPGLRIQPDCALDPCQCASAALQRGSMSFRLLRKELIKPAFTLKRVEVVAPADMEVIDEYL